MKPKKNVILHVKEKILSKFFHKQIAIVNIIAKIVKVLLMRTGLQDS